MRQANPSRRSWLDGGSWIPHRLEMLLSPAWQARTRPLARILERLDIEHCRHGGAENGGLCVSYEQFVAYGVSKKSIRSTLDFGVALGLLEVIQSGEMVSNIKPENVYRLTYVPAKGHKAPTDEWRQITSAEATRLLAAHKLRLAAEPEETDREAVA